MVLFTGFIVKHTSKLRTGLSLKFFSLYVSYLFKKNKTLDGLEYERLRVYKWLINF